MKIFNKLVVALVAFSLVGGTCFPVDEYQTLRPAISQLEEQLGALIKDSNPQALSKEQLINLAQDKQNLEETIILLRELETQKDIAEYWRDVEQKAKRGTLIAGVAFGLLGIVGAYLIWKGYSERNAMIAERDTARGQIIQERQQHDAAIAAERANHTNDMNRKNAEVQAARLDYVRSNDALGKALDKLGTIEAQYATVGLALPNFQKMIELHGDQALLLDKKLSGKIGDVDERAKKLFAKQEKEATKMQKELDKLRDAKESKVGKKLEKVTKQLANAEDKVVQLEAKKAELEGDEDGLKKNAMKLLETVRKATGLKALQEEVEKLFVAKQKEADEETPAETETEGETAEETPDEETPEAKEEE